MCKKVKTLKKLGLRNWFYKHLIVIANCKWMGKMIKKFIIVGITFFLISFFLCGCDEYLEENENTDKVKLLIYSVKTQKEDGFEKIDDGFVHSEDAYRYVVSGTVKNIVNETINHIKITVKFYDENNSYLVSRFTHVHYLDKSQTGDFEVCYYNFNDYFERIDHVNFSISAY